MSKFWETARENNTTASAHPGAHGKLVVVKRLKNTESGYAEITVYSCEVAKLTAKLTDTETVTETETAVPKQPLRDQGCPERESSPGGPTLVRGPLSPNLQLTAPPDLATPSR